MQLSKQGLQIIYEAEGMFMRRKYKVVHHLFLESLVNLANQHLKMGWQCVGGITQIEVDLNEKSQFQPLLENHYAQSMLWEEKESTPTTQQNNLHIGNVIRIDQERIAA